MADERIIRIVVDRSQAQAELAALDSQLQQVGRSGKQVGDAMSSASAGVQRMSQMLKQVGMDSAGARQMLDQVGQSGSKVRAELENVGNTAAATGGKVQASSGVMREAFVLLREGMRGNASRMVGSLSLMAQYTGSLEGAFGSAASYLSGPWTLAIVGVIAVGALLVKKFVDFGNATDDAVKKLEEHYKQSLIDQKAQEIFGKSVDGVTEAVKRNRDEIQNLIDTDKTAAQIALEHAQAEEVKTLALDRSTVAILKQQEANLAAANSIHFGAAGGAGAYGAQQFFQNQVDTAKQNRQQAEANLAAQQHNVDSAKSMVMLEDARMSTEDKINKQYHDQENSLRAQAVAHGKVNAQLQQRLDLLEKERAAAVKNAAQSDRDAGKQISAQQAIYRLGLDIEGQGFKVSENSHFGGVTPGVHHGLGHAQDRAIDVNSVAGDDAAVTWARARDTALAMESASKGFIALFNHTRYAPDGHGGFTTSGIPGGQDQHTSHVHIEAQGAMKPNGLGNPGEAEMAAANKLREQAKSLDDSNAKYKTLVGTITQAANEESTRQKLLNDIGNKVTQIYSNADGTLKIDQADLDTKVKAAQLAESQLIDSKAAQQINKDNLKGYDDENKLRAKLSMTMAGQNAQLQAFAQQDEDNAKVQAALDQKANELKKLGLDPSQQLYKTAMSEAEQHERTTIALEHQNALAKQLKDAYKQALESNAQRGDVKAGLALNQLNYDQQVNSLQPLQLQAYTMTGPARKALQDVIDYATAAFKNDQIEANLKVASDFYNRFQASIDDLATEFGDLFGQKIGKLFGSLATAINAVVNHQNPRNDPFTKGLGDLQDLSKNLGQTLTANNQQLFGQNGEFYTGLSKTLAKAGEGAAIGQAVGTVGSMIAPNRPGVMVGSEIGGSLGMMVGGPVGAIIGSVAGAVLGGIIGGKTPPENASTKVGVDKLTGQFTVGAVTSTGGGQNKQAAADLAAAIAGTVNQFAQTVGAVLSGNISESIQVKGKKSPAYYVDGQRFDDPAQAQFVAEQKALLATLQNVSDFTMRIIKGANSTNWNSVLQVATNYEAVLKGLADIKDPMGSQVTTFIHQMDQLVTGMTALGATSAELANVTEYREAKLKDILKQNLQQLQDFQTTLSGAGSGIPDVQRLNSEITQFQQLYAEKLAGQPVDQNQFVTTGQDIFQLAGQVYGPSTQQFQDIRTMLMADTQGMIDSYNADYNQAIIDAQNATTAAVQTSNAYLGQIVGLLSNGGTAGAGTNGGASSSSSNGSYDYGSYGGGSSTKLQPDPYSASY